VLQKGLADEGFTGPFLSEKSTMVVTGTTARRRKSKEHTSQTHRAKYATKDKAVAAEVARLILGDAMASEKPASNAQTIADLAAMYLDYANDYYRRPDGTATSMLVNVRVTLGAFVESYGDYKPEDFGPVKLRQLRKLWIETGRWNRTVINFYISIIKQMFQWAASHELAPVHIFQALKTVEGLKQGRTEARESKPVKPVAAEHIYKMLPMCHNILRQCLNSNYLQVCDPVNL